MDFQTTKRLTRSGAGLLAGLTLAVGIPGPAAAAPVKTPPSVDANTLSSNEPADAYGRALALYGARKHGPALKEFLLFVLDNPDDPRAEKALHWAREIGQSVKSDEDALTLDTARWADTVRKADVLAAHRRRDAADAVEKMERLARSLAIGRTPLAHLRQEDVDPNALDRPRLDAASLDRYDRALARARRALWDRPKGLRLEHAEENELKGYALLFDGELAGALNEWKLALAWSPEDAALKTRVRRLEKEVDYRRRRDEAKTLALAAMEEMKAGRPAAAVPSLRKAAALDPSSREIDRQLKRAESLAAEGPRREKIQRLMDDGQKHAAAGRLLDAVQCWVDVLTLDPAHAGARARLRSVRGRPDNATRRGPRTEAWGRHARCPRHGESPRGLRRRPYPLLRWKFKSRSKIFRRRPPLAGGFSQSPPGPGTSEERTGQPVNIKTRFALFTGAAVLATTVVTAGLAFRLQKRLIEDGLASARDAHLSGFAAVCRQALANDNDLLIVSYVRLLHELPGVRYAYYADADGRLQVHSDRNFILKKETEWAASKPAGTLEAGTDVGLGRQSAGRAVIGFAEEHQAAALRQALRATLVGLGRGAGLVVLAGLMLSLWLAHRLAAPVRLLVTGAKAVGGGDFKTRVDVDRDDEIGALARQFNDMARQLAVLDELKDDFIHSVSHDLRTPLAAIRMYADFMMTHKDAARFTPDQKLQLTAVLESAARLDVYVCNMLDAAKIKAGRMEYHPQAVDLSALAAGIYNLYSVIAQKNGVELQAKIPSDLPPFHADPERLEHVLSNLVSNALKFTERGGRVTVGGRAMDGAVELFVADTGKGIPAEDLPALFARYHQSSVGEQRAKRVKGTGLGLSIVKKTVEDMGGTVAVESKAGQGTRFTVRLPRAAGGGGDGR